MLRHSTSHLMAQAVFDLFPGAKYAIGPAIADGFYYDFELPDGQHFTETTSSASRPGCARSSPRTSRSCARSTTSTTGSSCSPTSRTSRRSSATSAPAAARRRRRGRGRRRRHGRRLPQRARRRQRRVRRPVPRPARPVDRQARRVQAHEGRGRVLARRREAPDAPAHLRHRVGERQGARRSTCTGSRRPSGATTASSAPSSTCSRSPRRSAPGLAVFHPKGGTVRRIMEEYSRAAPRSRPATSS